MEEIQKIVQAEYLTLSKNDPCLCESNLKSSECCFKSAVWFKEPAMLKLPGDKTNFSMKKCYARDLCDCSEKISKEHYISRSVLEVIKKNDEKIAVRGSAWIPDNDFRILPVESLTAKNLCVRHNNSLSPVDFQTARFFRTLLGYMEDFDATEPKKQMSVFSGHDLERWLLKTAVGIMESGQLKQNGKSIKLFDANLVKLLYGFYRWPDGGGLYVEQSAKKFRPGVGFSLHANDSGDNLLGVRFLVHNFAFNLIFRGNPENNSKFGVYRPRTIIFVDTTVHKSLEITWRDKNNENVMIFDRTTKK